MDFVRRLLGGSQPETSEDVSSTPAELDDAERAHELDILRGEQARLDDLQQRQLRYENYAWQPPAEGGERRADDEPPGT